jgi:Protein of unknown function (DUF2721)
MLSIPNNDLVPILQTAIGPVILISGIGLLLLTMTNRLGRTIDRARELAAHTPETSHTEGQLAILWLRARLIRLAILLAAMSTLCVAVLVILLFLTVLLKIEVAWLIGGLFIAGMVLLIGSLTLFIHDVNKSLGALKLELQKHKTEKAYE